MDYLRSIIAVCSLRTSAWRPEAHSYGDFLRQHSCRVLDKTNGRPLAVGDKRAATARPIGMRQRHNHSGATKVASNVGKSNDMADIASRVFNEKFPAHLLDSPFQYYFSEKSFAGRILERCAPEWRDRIRSHLDAGRQAIALATLDEDLRVKNWRGWQHWTGICGVDPFLTGYPPAEQQIILIGFSDRIRSGYYGKGNRVGAQTVETASRHILQAIVLAGGRDPRRLGSRGAAHNLDISFSRLHRLYSREDPPQRQHMAVPMSLVEELAGYHRILGTALDLQLADLTTFAIFYLLRPGEYTRKGRKRNLTVPLRRCDLRLWRGNTLLPHDAPLATLLTADGGTIMMSIQKSGVRNETAHH